MEPFTLFLQSYVHRIVGSIRFVDSMNSAKAVRFINSTDIINIPKQEKNLATMKLNMPWINASLSLISSMLSSPAITGHWMISSQAAANQCTSFTFWPLHSLSATPYLHLEADIGRDITFNKISGNYSIVVPAWSMFNRSMESTTQGGTIVIQISESGPALPSDGVNSNISSSMSEHTVTDGILRPTRHD